MVTGVPIVTTLVLETVMVIVTNQLELVTHVITAIGEHIVIFLVPAYVVVATEQMVFALDVQEIILTTGVQIVLLPAPVHASEVAI